MFEKIRQIFAKDSKWHMGLGHFARIASKVTIVTLAGFLTIYIIHSAIEKAFEKISGNIDELARPNVRLIAVNHLFRDVSKLNHILQEETASGRKNLSLSYFDMSDSIFNNIDSLRRLFATDTLQLERIDQIEEKLLHREQILVNYLEVQHQLGTDPGLSNLMNQISTQAKEVERQEENFDSDTTALSNTTDTIHIEKEEPEEKRRSLWRRIFTKKEIEEETFTTTVDVVEANTISKDALKLDEVASARKTIANIEKSIVDISTKRQQLSAVFQRQQLELLNTNSFLVQEIISIINIVEQEELARQHNETRDSFITAGRAIKQLNIIAVIFISISIMLFILIIIDLSSSNKYRKQLELANQRAKDEAKAKLHFLSNMSHEIRTPLQSIYGYAEQAQLNPKNKINISAIYNSASHLLEIVNEVLNYSMVISGKISFDKKSFNPIIEIEKVVEGMQPLAKKKNIHLKFQHLFEKNCHLVGDPLRLRQVLFNILGNAVKFTDSGSVLIKAEYKKNHLFIAVEDTGIGIAESHLPKLFQKYTQTDPSISSKYGGTGLGLSIAKEMIEMQGGEIQVKSKINEGTIFTIKIPYKRNKNRTVPKTKEKDQDQDYLFHEVYFADDDPLILSLCSAILQKHNIPHKTFQAGHDLIEKFKKHPVPMVFLDMRMPDMNGMEICQQLRKVNPSKETLRIYALTAQVLPHEKEGILKNGFNGIINKPFKESKLLDLLRLNENGEEESKDLETSVKVDISVLEKIAGDDHELVQDILTSVIDETKKDLIDISTAIKEDDHATVTLIIHRLAGRLGQTGASQLSMQLREMEIILKQADSTKPSYAALQGLISKLNIFLSEVEKRKSQS